MIVQREYVRGEVVGYVAAKGFRDQVPLPQRWYILQVQPGRDGKVIKAFNQRDITGYSPVIVRSIDRASGAEARRPHLGRQVIKPMLPGLVFVPDFDAGHQAIGSVDYIDDWLQLGPRLATLSPADMQIIRQIEAAYNMRGRKVGIAQFVRITSGQFADFVGQVERLDSGGRLKVFIAALMSGASLIVDEAQVEPVSQPAGCATARRPKRKRDARAPDSR